MLAFIDIVLNVPYMFLVCFLASTQNQVSGQNRIIGGLETKIEDFPFLVEISLHGGGNSPLCGGTIISQSWGLSASHCFMLVDGNKLKINDYVVISGTTYTKDKLSKDTSSISFYNISEFHMHEHFGVPSKSSGFDIAVFKVDPPFKFSEVVAPARLPKMGEALNQESATAAGWGCTVLGGHTSSVLLYVEVPKVSSEKCMSLYPDISLEDSVICYGTPKDEKYPKNICEGDSGGPLVVDKNVVIGVVSMSKKADAAIPALYTSVSFFRDWIKGKTAV